MLAGQIRPAVLRQRHPRTYGLRTLLRKMVELFPSPAERPAAGGGPAGGAGSFKTMSEPHVGDVTLFRLYAG